MTLPPPAYDDRIAGAGVDVERLAAASVLIVLGDHGGDPRRQPVLPLARALAALPFQAVHVRGGTDYHEALFGRTRETPCTQEPGLWIADAFPAVAPHADILVDLTNDAEQAARVAGLADARRAARISAAWTATWLSVTGGHRPVPGVMPDATRVPHAPPQWPVARVAAGLILHEILRSAGGVEDAAPVDPVVTYNVASDARTGRTDGGAWTDVRIETAVIDVIGAGGIGVHAIECLVPMLGAGCELRVFDDDRIGPENLALQTPYALEDVGRAKAEVIAEKTRAGCHPRARIVPWVVRYQDRPRELPAPALRVVCPDNYATRRDVNAMSLCDGVPLVEAGSAPLAARQHTYVPGVTACLAHQMPRLAERAQAERETASCSANRAYTLPSSNMVAAGLLAAEAVRALHPDRYGRPSRGAIAFDARFPRRLGIVGVRPPCRHVDGTERRRFRNV